MNKIKLIIALISTTIGLFLPILLYILGKGYQDSFSKYHLTVADNFLTLFLLMISLGFFVGKDLYKISGLLLILITFITIDNPIPHNIIAGMFFSYTGIIMFIDKRFWCLSIPIFLMGFTIPIYGLYPFEIVSVFSISFFNLLYILRFMRAINVR